MNDASTMFLRRYDVSRKRGSGGCRHYEVELEPGYRCDILRNIPMIYSTKLNPRHMWYIYIYIILRCLRLSVVSNLYPSLVDFVMVNCMASILDADPRGMNSMIACASDLRLHHRTHR